MRKPDSGFIQHLHTVVFTYSQTLLSLLLQRVQRPQPAVQCQQLNHRAQTEIVNLSDNIIFALSVKVVATVCQVGELFFWDIKG